jgi:hypothetical protein
VTHNRKSRPHAHRFQVDLPAAANSAGLKTVFTQRPNTPAASGNPRGTGYFLTSPHPKRVQSIQLALGTQNTTGSAQEATIIFRLEIQPI